MEADTANTEPVVTSNWMDDDSASEAVVKAVAAAAGKPPTEIDRLYEVVDPDALDRVFDGASHRMVDADPAVEFVFNGMLVRVRSDGQVALFDRD